MKKVYYAYVVQKVKNYFEDGLRHHGAIILNRDLVINPKNNKPLYFYIVEAEEGIIDPKWEVKTR